MAAPCLPSYQEATKRPDWLQFVAPYIPFREYAPLCLVSRRFYHQFAPRLWNDPLSVARKLGRDEDPTWLLRFLEHSARYVRAETRALVTCLDLRGFAVGAGPLFADGRSLSKALRLLSATWPRLRCLLLDRHPGLADLDALRVAPGSNSEPLLLLSIAHCRDELPPSFFASPHLKSLVYLDVSDIPGSLRGPLVQRTLCPANLPSLRILKAQKRELDNKTASLLFKVFKTQLWSVDLSGNKLTDGVFDDIHEYSFPEPSSRTGDFAVEGRVVHRTEGSGSFGRFCTVNESEWSVAFSHPHRFLADAPFYATHAHDGPEPPVNPRLSGQAKVRPDSADGIKKLFSGDAGSHAPLLEHLHELDVCREQQGITHLHLNGNKVSAAALGRFLRSSSGQLQHLECDSMSFNLPQHVPSTWLSKASLSGILGLAHLFRPVFSANLQALRIHHSLVTQLLSLELGGMSAMASLWVAETLLLPRAELAYPEAFVPDMNPRLQSLVLTQIPRYSAGPLIHKLIHFLKLASIQERAIQDIKATNRRGPATLLGLRHIRFEFEPDPRDALEDDVEIELPHDPAAVMDDYSKDFSFFGESNWSSEPSTTSKPSSMSTAAVERHSPRNPSEPRGQTCSCESARPESPHSPSSHESHPSTEATHLLHTWSWNAQTFTLPVWIGFRTADQCTPAVREYMRLLRAQPHLQADPVPASPCHVAAGVPPGELIFSAAWEAILVPPSPPPTPAALHFHSAAPLPPLPPPSATTVPDRSRNSCGFVPRPTRDQLSGMRDVLAAIKAYRAQTKRAYEELKRTAERDGGRGEVKLGEPHFHWTGRLEVSVEEGSSRYWDWR